MTDITIHHINISYDENENRVRDFVMYLKDEKRKKEMLAYYNSAKASKGEKYIMAFGHEFSFNCNDGHTCILKLRGT